jgi:hypothetical protein
MEGDERASRAGPTGKRSPEVYLAENRERALAVVLSGRSPLLCCCPAMLDEFARWKVDLSQALRHLYFIEFYLGRGDRGTESYGARFRTAMHRLYHEGRFEQLFAVHTWQHAGLDEESAQLLQGLKALVDAFEEPDTDAAILADPGWHRILQHARALDEALHAHRWAHRGRTTKGRVGDGSPGEA